MQVGDDPGPVGERLVPRRGAAAAAAEAAVEAVELACDVGEVAARRRVRLRRSRAQRLVLGQARDRRGGELRLLARPRAARRRRRPQPRPRAGACAEPVGRGSEDGCLGEHTRRGPSGPARAHVDAVAQAIGIAGRPTAASCAAGDLPVGQLASERSAARATGSEAESQLDDDQLSLLAGPEEVEIDARRDQLVVAREALGGGRGRLLGGRRRARRSGRAGCAGAPAAAGKSGVRARRRSRRESVSASRSAR